MTWYNYSTSSIYSKYLTKSEDYLKRKLAISFKWVGVRGSVEVDSGIFGTIRKRTSLWRLLLITVDLCVRGTNYHPLSRLRMSVYGVFSEWSRSQGGEKRGEGRADREGIRPNIYAAHLSTLQSSRGVHLLSALSLISLYACMCAQAWFRAHLGKGWVGCSISGSRGCCG